MVQIMFNFPLILKNKTVKTISFFINLLNKSTFYQAQKSPLLLLKRERERNKERKRERKKKVFALK